jgi:hypothetical protein
VTRAIAERERVAPAAGTGEDYRHDCDGTLEGTAGRLRCTALPVGVRPDVMTLPMGDQQDDESAIGSLWTTPATPTRAPLMAAALDHTVSAGDVHEAVRAVRRRAQTFSGRVTDEMLHTSF